ncbi:HAD-IA family hydrolase [Rubrobacter marinus]|uniref:HAD-IA family hydrolase n=1 Tax=Rubrobacter marinus TaxID=2653852 RepID=A0A6G8PW42_9ACTN|nr:HAD family phosphatase [Rubrobacter marinus]QIN78377.1 HAD-IA family hydrolase [Rubrobacter marinus]
MTKAMFFDLDGTLTDTHALHIATWLEVLRPYGLEVDMSLYREKLLGLSNEEAVRELLPHLGDGERSELLEAEAKSYRGRADQVGPILGLGALLKEGRRQEMGIVLVTNAPREDARRSLEALGLDEAFDPMIFAEEVGAEKPDPTPYRVALERLGFQAGETLAFEDSPKGVKSAAEAGIPVVGLVSTHAPNELREAGAEFVVGDFADPAVYERLGR